VARIETLSLDECAAPVDVVVDLLANLIDNGWNANIICETPKRDIDALKMKEIYEEMI
jgi:deoxyribonuclease-4